MFSGLDSHEATLPGANVHEEQYARIFTNALSQQLPQVLSIIISFALVPIILHRLGTEAYGFWLFAIAMPGIIASFDAGLFWTSALIASRSVEEHPADAGALAPIAVIYLAIGLVGAMVIGGFGWVLVDQHHFSPMLREAAPIVFSAAALLFLFDRVAAFATSVLSGLRRFNAVNVLTTMLHALRAIGLVLLLNRFATVQVLAVWSCVVSFLLASALLVLVARTGLLGGSFRRWNVKRQHLTFGITSVGISLAQSAIVGVPAVLLGLVSGPAATAIMSFGQRPATVVADLTWRAAEVLFPEASLEQQRNQDILAQISSFSARWITAYAFPILAVMSLYAPVLLEFWLQRPVPESATVMRILVVGILVESFMVGPLHIIWGKGNAAAVACIITPQALTAVIGSFLLVHRLGVIGVAAAITTGCFVACGVLLAIVKKFCGITPLRLVRDTINFVGIPALIFLSILIPLSLISMPVSIKLTAFPAACLVIYVMLLYRQSKGDDRALMDRLLSHLGGISLGIRRLLKRSDTLRSLYYLSIALREMRVWGRPRNVRNLYETYFDSQVDPWSYATASLEKERFQTALQLLDSSPAQGSFGRVLEVACAEGHFTEPLSLRSSSLLAVDISPAALERARLRCPFPHVSFRQWDLVTEEVPGAFDLIVVMDVLELFYNPLVIRRLRKKLVSSLTPGGYLLVGNTRHHFVESTWWSRFLLRGGIRINEFIGRYSELQQVGVITTELCVNSLFRRRIAP